MVSSASSFDGVLRDLRNCLSSPDQILADPDRLITYREDYSPHSGGSGPNVVVFPESEEDVVSIVKCCSTHNVPLIPFGAGTSLEGNTLAQRGGVTLSMERMNRVLRINQDDLDVVVEPGIPFILLNKILARKGLFFPMDAGPMATIGGMASCSASGTKAVLYGTMKENVLAVRAVLADGRVVKTGNRARKCVAGYDLTHLLVGSEGTLGIMTQITLRVRTIPRVSSVALAAMPTVEGASRVVIEMMQDKARGVDVTKLSMVEFLDGEMMRAINAAHHTAYREAPTLMLEFSCADQASLDAQRTAVRATLERHGGGGMVFAETPEQSQELWKVRKAALFAAKKLRAAELRAQGDSEESLDVWTTDVSVPISRLSDCISQTIADIEATPLHAPIVGHVGDGNFHLFILIKRGDEEELRQAQALNKRLVNRAISMEGTCTGEHGVGMGKREHLGDELGESAVEMMRIIKRALDPKGILNPSKVIPDGPAHGSMQHHARL